MDVVREHLHKYDFTKWFMSKFQNYDQHLLINFDVELLNLFVENLLIEESTKNHMINVPDLMKRIIDTELLMI